MLEKPRQKVKVAPSTTQTEAELEPQLDVEDFGALECQHSLRAPDQRSDILFRDCSIDYVRCPQRNCIKNLT